MRGLAVFGIAFLVAGPCLGLVSLFTPCSSGTFQSSFVTHVPNCLETGAGVLSGFNLFVIGIILLAFGLSPGRPSARPRPTILLLPPTPPAGGCPSCGSGTGPGAAFCRACGKPLGTPG
jgi:hypothetical protein